MELQQSSEYQKYIELLGWTVTRVDRVNIFHKHIPLMGRLAKIQRPSHLPNVSQLVQFVKSNRIKTLAFEPISSLPQLNYSDWIKSISPYVKINRSPYLPTKTICVDLTASEEKIFKRFSEAKRRAVRRAQHQGVTIEESNNITDLIKIKNKSSGLFGFITTYGVKELYQIFGQKHTTILLAYHDHVSRITYHVSRNLIGGILLLFWNNTAFYWIAGATKKGKKLFAPTLLVWEALQVAKKRGAKQFDFIGVWDERIPKQNKEWLGFTKFKEGFGGNELYYPIVSSADK